MNLDEEIYQKLEKKYFYLPQICRETNKYNKELFNSSNVSIYININY